MKTPNVNAVSETESWICHQLCGGFFAYCAMDCQARSQDFGKGGGGGGGGLFWKSVKSANDLDPNFYCS